MKKILSLLLIILLVLQCVLVFAGCENEDKKSDDGTTQNGNESNADTTDEGKKDDGTTDEENKDDGTTDTTPEEPGDESEERLTSQGLEFTSNGDGTCYVSGIGTCTDTDVVIPLVSPDGDSVTSIGEEAFVWCDGLTSITIPDSVTSIGSDAFAYCDSLTSVTIGNGVTSIGDYAFYGCGSLTNLIIPDSVTNICEGAFVDCIGLMSVTIGNGVTSVGERAFGDCFGLTSVTIGSSITSIGDGAFGDCPKLVEVINKSSLPITPNSTDYGSVARYAKEVHNGMTKIVNQNGYLFYTYNGVNYLLGYAGTDAELNLPRTYNNENYEIYEYAFADCTGLTSVTIDNGIAIIGDFAFAGCTGLTSVTIGNRVTSIGWRAFVGCSGLTTIIIPASVTSIGNYAFEDCDNLTSITVDVNNTVYHSDGNCLIETQRKMLILGCKNSVIPSNGSVTSIYYSAFKRCSNLTSITIPDSVTSIGNYAFDGCDKLVEVINKSSLSITAGSSGNGYVAYYAKEVHNGTTKIVNQNGYLFYTYDGVNYLLGYSGTDTELKLPESYNGENYEIYKYAFYKCSSLTSITIPDSVTSIDQYAFVGCTSLANIVIPDSVTSIGDCTFSGCTSLTSIRFKGTEEQWNSISKGSDWNYDTGNYTVYCTDGNILKADS